MTMMKNQRRNSRLLLTRWWVFVLRVVAVLLLFHPSDAWILTTTPTNSRGLRRRTTALLASGNDNNNSNEQQQQQHQQGGPLSFLFNPYESKIPPQLRDEIYAAEANTPAAQERGVRVATYSLLAFCGIAVACFNAFMTELRSTPLPEGQIGDPLTISGFDWVTSNFVTSFLFTNKLGGGICLLGGAGAGLLAEAELDTKRINAEKIFDEMERRRDKKGGSKVKKQQQSSSSQRRKKKRSGKEKKRLEALSELVIAEEEETKADKPSSVAEETPPQQASSSATDSATERKKDGLLGKIKGFYEKADSMAASQALLLNKKLEDEGLVEKITDETGLKVIGKEEAAKLQQQQQPEDVKSSKEETTK